MDRRTVLQSLAGLPLLGTTVLQAGTVGNPPVGNFAAGSLYGSATSLPETTVYELRIYHAHEGKLDDLLKRFREHTIALFDRHGIKSVAYWTALSEPLQGKTLIYIVAHPGREAAASNWAAFENDPEWQKVKAASEVSGKLVDSVDSHFMVMTDFSPRL